VFTWVAALAFLGGAAGSSAGIQGTGRYKAVLAYGPITAFGSIFVEGVEYSLDNASISINGQPATAAQLEVGQIVTVNGMQAANTNTGTAAQVSFDAEVIGPVSQVDVAGQRLTVLGQSVQVDGATVLGAGIQPGTFAGLQPGSMVEISAFEDTTGALHASRIDLVAGSALVQVKGTVEALDVTAQTFKLNELTVDYSGAQVGGKLVNGGTATVRANDSPAGAVLYASRVQVSSGLGGTAHERGQLEGLITSMSSVESFTVAGQSVQTTAGTHFILHGQTLAPNLAVRIQGTFTDAGVLLADKVQVRSH
jgi:hypothetical protein